MVQNKIKQCRTSTVPAVMATILVSDRMTRSVTIPSLIAACVPASVEAISPPKVIANDMSSVAVVSPPSPGAAVAGAVAGAVVSPMPSAPPAVLGLGVGGSVGGAVNGAELAGVPLAKDDVGAGVGMAVTAAPPPLSPAHWVLEPPPAMQLQHMPPEAA